ncbi:unnamed protein product [Amoebophrya sp. A120]|nr:unnamed protein product [Amoebophrya sp. A120]|eukprot:GSA120T00006920001.1
MSSPSRATTAAASGSRQTRAGSETSTGALGPAQKTQSSQFVLADLLQCDLLRPADEHGETGEGTLVALVLHPMYYLGGDKNNYVVTWLQHYLASQHRLPAVRYDTAHPSLRGYGETEDACKAVEALTRGDCAKHLPKCRRVLVVGYSAGANAAIAVGNRFATDERVAGIVALSPPFGFLGNLFLGGLIQSPSPNKRPQLYINGTNDGYCSVSAFKQQLQQLFPGGDPVAALESPSAEENRCTRAEGQHAVAVLVPNGTHFWAPREFRAVCLYYDLLKRYNLERYNRVWKYVMQEMHDHDLANSHRTAHDKFRSPKPHYKLAKFVLQKV